MSYPLESISSDAYWRYYFFKSLRNAGKALQNTTLFNAAKEEGQK
jgi:hypothetical protein